MPKTRKRKNEAAAPEPTEKPKRRGRPRTGTAMKTGIYIRCSHEQRAALQEFVDRLSAKREKKGLPRVDVSTWLRELGLKHSGNEHLGAAAKALARAEAASIV